MNDQVKPKKDIGSIFAYVTTATLNIGLVCLLLASFFLICVAHFYHMGNCSDNTTSHTTFEIPYTSHTYSMPCPPALNPHTFLREQPTTPDNDVGDINL